MGLFNLRKNKRYSYSGKYTALRNAQIDANFLLKGGTQFYRNRINTYLKNGMIKAEAEAKAMEDFEVFHHRSVGASGQIKMKSKFDEFRTTVGDDNNFRNKFRNAIDDYKNGTEKSVRKRLIFIFLILVTLFLLFFLI